jgi:hypothetical protein
VAEHKILGQKFATTDCKNTGKYGLMQNVLFGIFSLEQSKNSLFFQLILSITLSPAFTQLKEFRFLTASSNSAIAGPKPG